MSKTLNLNQHLLFEGRRYYAVGADQQAFRTFGRLAHLRDLPPDIAEETQFHLAELLLKQRKFAKARRHLTAALAHDADNPEYHYMMASAHEDDPKGNARLALHHYRQCVRLDPENAYYHVDAGRFAAGHGELKLGLTWLQRSAELAPDEADIIGEVVRCLQEQGELDEAQSIARAALFRNSRNPQFHRLWNDVRFQDLHQRQQQIQKTRRIRRAEVEGPVCLPFLKLTVMTPRGRKLVRQDGPSHPRPPHLASLGAVRNQKHA
jgi:Tfp pilus assembly protein PilF